MGCFYERHDHGNQHYLRDDPPYDLSPHGPFRVYPPVKTLHAPQRLARKMRMNELQRIRQKRTPGSEHNCPDPRRRSKQQSARNKAQQRIAADRDYIQHQRPVTLQPPSHRRVHESRPDRVIPMRNRIEREMTGKAQQSRLNRMRR